jgi:hypothetical protein
MNADLEIIGADSLVAQLLAIPRNLRTAIEKTAMQEAGKHVADTLRQNAPKETGALQKSFKHIVRNYRGNNIVVGLAGVDKKFVGTVERNKKGKKVFKKSKNAEGKRRFPAKYLHLVDLGWQPKGDGKRVDGLRFREQTTQQVAGDVERILTYAVQEALR